MSKNLQKKAPKSVTKQVISARKALKIHKIPPTEYWKIEYIEQNKRHSRE